MGTGQGHWADDGRPHPATISIFDASSPTRAPTHISYDGLLSATLACSWWSNTWNTSNKTWFLQDPVATSRPHPRKPLDSDLLPHLIYISVLYLSRRDILYIKWGKLVFHCHFISSLAWVYLQSHWSLVENKLVITLKCFLSITGNQITRTNWPRKVRELILYSDPWS